MNTSQKKKEENGKSKSTILLRYPMPKYGFQGRKLEKSNDERMEEKMIIRQDDPTARKSEKIKESVGSQRATAVLVKPHLQDTENASPKKTKSKIQPDIVSSQSVPKKDQVAIEPFKAHASNNKADVSSNVSKPVNVVSPATSSTNLSIPSLSADPRVPSLSLTQKHATDQSKENEARLTKEVESLKSQLEVQLQVNSELKRLLLASMGEDLERNVERLARDKAQLSLELGDHVRKMTADYEHLDKISIQADMWRSKFLASRVMIDELANAKAFYSLQYQESQDALQKMLNERHEIRTNLLEGYKCLQQVKDAFDPLNTHQSSALQSTNILDLAKRSQQLAEIIRYRLLPASAKVHSVIDIEANWQDRLTPAENLAHEVISKNVCPTDFHYKMPQALLGSSATSANIERFHPHTRYDNLTYNCCSHCKGDISVI